ncbi:hypothetical protein ACRALDRAFT_206801 [Sodiomyces alcalophilus JCM 7366]|uniref:uncharacterized protein n=1 Tax=Sodiomyces alcalophilus JCM 7366 TaxID=591952 RepID=UPI0039B4EE84
MYASKTICTLHSNRAESGPVRKRKLRAGELGAVTGPATDSTLVSVIIQPEGRGDRQPTYTPDKRITPLNLFVNHAELHVRLLSENSDRCLSIRHPTTGIANALRIESVEKGEIERYACTWYCCCDELGTLQRFNSSTAQRLNGSLRC